MQGRIRVWVVKTLFFLQLQGSMINKPSSDTKIPCVSVSVNIHRQAVINQRLNQSEYDTGQILVSLMDSFKTMSTGSPASLLPQSMFGSTSLLTVCLINPKQKPVHRLCQGTPTNLSAIIL